MDSKEVRARALYSAVRIGAAWKMESAGDVVALAVRFEQYINGNDTMHRVQGATPIKARLLTEETPEEVWGGPCATCGHSTGVHLPVLGCEHPDGCECAWPDTSAPAPEKCEGCTQGSHPHVFAKCSNCECTDTVGAPLCECGHGKSAHSGAPQHCDAWISVNTLCPCSEYTRSTPAPEPASAPECGCTHRAERHGPEAGCVECKCTWTGSAP